MPKEFRVKKGYRIIISLIAILFCIAILRDTYKYFYYEFDSNTFQINLILAGCTLVLVFFALNSNSLIYRIFDDEIAIKSFLKKEKKYSISKIEVVEILSDRFSIIKIFFTDGKKITLMPIENETQFIEILEGKLKVLGRAWSFVRK